MMIETQKLRDKYPRLIPNPFGFECNAGWVGLLDDFFAVVDRVLPADAVFHLRQVKEKYGSLRIYFGIDGDVPDEVWRAINEAECRAQARSAFLCETCGKRGRMSKRGSYYTVVCPDHADDDGRLAIPLEAVGGNKIKGAEDDSWREYNFDADAFLPCDPPKGWK